MAERSRDRSGATDRCMAAMKEDLVAWMSCISGLVITVETLLEDLETGVVLCRLANVIQSTGEEFLHHNPSIPRDTFPPCGVTYKERTGFRGSFIARDNVANFIRWCRQLGVSDIIMFETEDLVLHKNEKSVILTLMDVARISVKFGLEPPDLVRMENEIDQEMEQVDHQPDEIMEEPMIRLKKEHKSHSLDDLVYQVLDQCTCPVRFPVLRVAEGKYRMGESKSLIFVRVMRKHVMVRVGGGWDTLERYFDKHDPCKVSERQRRNSVKSPRSRSGSDAIGRSPSSLSISSTDSHDSCGLPVAHGRAASWSSSQSYSSQLKSPRDPVRQMKNVSPTRSSSSPSSPRLQHRQRRSTMTRETPPRTFDTQQRGRLSRRSKSMQELTNVVVDGRSPSYSKPTSSSIRKQSLGGESSPREGASVSPGAQGQGRRTNLAASPRRSSITQVSRSASFGSRPRPMVPVMEPRSRTEVSSRPARENQRRASSATPTRSQSKDDIRRREPNARRRSASVTAEAKTRLPRSPKSVQTSTEDKKERSRKPSVTKIPTTKQKQEEPVTNRKVSTGSKDPVRRSLPSTPREKKSTTTQQNSLNNSVKAASKSTVGEGRTAPPSLRRENKSGNQKKELVSAQAKKSNAKNTTVKKINKTNDEDDKAYETGIKEKAEMNGMDSEDNSSVISNGQRDGSCNLSDDFEKTGINSHTRDISSLDERYTLHLVLNGGRKMSAGSLETESDITSDLLSDFTDTDYDLKSQRYSGLSETSSDFSFGACPAWNLFYSAESERNTLESTPEPDALELGTSPTVRDCLMNLKLQGSVTPTMKKRIFDESSKSNQKEQHEVSTNDLVTQPVDKAMFFDVEQYNDECPDEENVIVGSPGKLSLVQSLISSIERRSGGIGGTHRTSKNVAAISRSVPVNVSKPSLDETTVTHAAIKNNHEILRPGIPPFDDLNKRLQDDFSENDNRETSDQSPSPERNTPPRDLPVVYDVNENISSLKLSSGETRETQRIPGEKPFVESLESKDQGIETRKVSRDKAKRKDKEMDAFPRPQRQFTLEEMIQDMLPTEAESKESGDQRISSPQARFQAWL